MVLARVAEYFSPSTSPTPQPFVGGEPADRLPGFKHGVGREQITPVMEDIEEEEEPRPEYVHAMLAGGLGGLCGDMLMHSLDTVKTRQQGDMHRPSKYFSLGPSYLTIFRQEGVIRGLYGGVTPAAVGSFGGTCVFFGTYEWSKRIMIERYGIAPSVAYLCAGLVADLAASPLYVPTEVIKTRLQLQGRFNNPYFKSGYNYRSSLDAARTIVKVEGAAALFHGYRATLYRDLPFSALQFAFYEKERELAKWWMGSKDIGLPLEILTGMTAGGMAGTITCPLDVVKTRIQTQITPSAAPASTPTPSPRSATTRTVAAAAAQRRHISTSSPSTTLRNPAHVTLDTSSVLTGLKLIYRTEGLAGCFRGVGPRAVWTSVQSGTMLVLYQALLRYFDENPLVRLGDGELY